MKTKWILSFSFLLAMVAAIPAEAQSKSAPSAARETPKAEEVEADFDVLQMLRLELLKFLYPLPLIKQYRVELKLTDEQNQKMRKAFEDTQKEIRDLKNKARGEAIKLSALIKKGAAKEQVYQQADLVFKHEDKAKKKQLGLLIVIKDMLSPEQRAFLDGVKQQWVQALKIRRAQQRNKMSRGGQGQPTPGGL